MLGYTDIVGNDFALGDEHEVDVLIEAVAEGLVVSLTFGDDQIGFVVDLLKFGAGMFDHCALGDVTVADDSGIFIHAYFIGILLSGIVDHRGASNAEVDLQIRVLVLDVFDEEFIQTDLAAVVAQIEQGFGVTEIGSQLGCVIDDEG